MNKKVPNDRPARKTNTACPIRERNKGEKKKRKNIGTQVMIQVMGGWDGSMRVGAETRRGETKRDDENNLFTLSHEMDEMSRACGCHIRNERSESHTHSRRLVRRLHFPLILLQTTIHPPTHHHHQPPIKILPGRTNPSKHFPGIPSYPIQTIQIVRSLPSFPYLPVVMLYTAVKISSHS